MAAVSADGSTVILPLNSACGPGGGPLRHLLCASALDVLLLQIRGPGLHLPLQQLGNTLCSLALDVRKSRQLKSLRRVFKPGTAAAETAFKDNFSPKTRIRPSGHPTAILHLSHCPKRIAFPPLEELTKISQRVRERRVIGGRNLGRGK
jgi:hypothetical protein